MSPLWQILPRRAVGLRVLVNHPGGPKVTPGVYIGVVAHVDRHPTRIVDGLELRLDDGTEIHVPGGTPGEVVTVIVSAAA